MNNCRKLGLPLIIVATTLMGCSVTQYYPGAVNAHTCGRCSQEKLVARHGTPDETKQIDDKSLQLTFLSGKWIWFGLGFFRYPGNKEQHVYILKDDRVIDEYQIRQFIDRIHWTCVNISGHGDICGTWETDACRVYNSDEWDSFCSLRVE